MEHFITFIGDGCHAFQYKKIQIGMQKIKFQRRATFHNSVRWNYFLHNFTAILRFFIKFLQTFANTFEALLSVEVNFVLKVWSLIFVDQLKFLLSPWPHIFWEIFALNSQILHFLYPSLSQIFLSNQTCYAVEAKKKRFLTYAVKQDMPHLP